MHMEKHGSRDREKETDSKRHPPMYLSPSRSEFWVRSRWVLGAQRGRDIPPSPGELLAMKKIPDNQREWGQTLRQV